MQGADVHGISGTDSADSNTPWQKRQSAQSPSQPVPITSLQSADSPRLAGESGRHAKELAQLNVDLPPIIVHRPTMRVIDGMHRLRAAELRGMKEIEARFFDGDENEAFVLAVEANVANGLPLSVADRRSAATRIIGSHPERSDRWIASITGLAAKTVAGIRCSTAENPLSNSRVGRDGRVRPIDSAERRRRAGELMRNNPDASIRDIARTAGIAPSTALDVRNRLRSGEDLVPTNRRDLERQKGTPEYSIPVGRRDARENGPPTQILQASILRRLRDDPSLRFNDSGRSLLRWLGEHTIDPAEWQPLVDRIPAHCADAIAELARYNAAAWSELCEQIEQG